MRPARPPSRNNGGPSIALCDDALALDSRAEDAAALKRKAVEAIEAEERERGVEGERALGRAEAHWRKKRFQEAMLELERARGFSPNATALHAFEERLRESIAQTERETQLAREADEAIAAARQAFSSGQRDQALADLRSFQARAPETAITAEISRLEAEAKRIAAAEQRAAEAAQQAQAAEAALAASNPQQALELANAALAIDPSHLLARKISGLARAEVRQQAEREARAATAARHLEEAKQPGEPWQVPEGTGARVGGRAPRPCQQPARSRSRVDPRRGGASRGRGGTSNPGKTARDSRRAYPGNARARRKRSATTCVPRGLPRTRLPLIWTAPKRRRSGTAPENSWKRSHNSQTRRSISRPAPAGPATPTLRCRSDARPGSGGASRTCSRRWTQRERTVAREKRQPDESPGVKTLPG